MIYNGTQRAINMFSINATATNIKKTYEQIVIENVQ
jgi:hypothetical protein